MSDIQYLYHLPTVPEHLLNPPQQLEGDDLGLPDRYLTRNGEKFHTGRYLRSPLNAELEQWIKTHIVDDWNNIGYGIITAPCHGPHIDFRRMYVLQYVIDTGGPDIQTVYYEPKHNKIEIDQKWHCNNYDDLIPLPMRTYRIPPKVWCLIDAHSGLHSTEGITTRRVSIQISLLKKPECSKPEFSLFS